MAKTVTKTAPKPTAESLALKAALAARGKAAAKELAELLEMEPSGISQWATARRPVPAKLAPAVADYLGVDPASISKQYAQVPPKAAPARGEVSEPLAISRLQNDVLAINYALAVLVGTMVRHRPAEAQEAAAALRKVAPARFRDMGLLKELLTTLDAAAGPKKRSTAAG